MKWRSAAGIRRRARREQLTRGLCVHEAAALIQQVRILYEVGLADAMIAFRIWRAVAAG